MYIYIYIYRITFCTFKHISKYLLQQFFIMWSRKPGEVADGEIGCHAAVAGETRKPGPKGPVSTRGFSRIYSGARNRWYILMEDFTWIQGDWDWTILICLRCITNPCQQKLLQQTWITIAIVVLWVDCHFWSPEDQGRNGTDTEPETQKIAGWVS